MPLGARNDTGALQQNTGKYQVNESHEVPRFNWGLRPRRINIKTIRVSIKN